jgi:type II secretory ATPase GspE/PulE/Tfp pilus assembly ATPase PilB-like protein
MSEQSILETIHATPVQNASDGPALSARDLALCSTEEARARIRYEDALAMGILPLAIVRSRKAATLHCAVAHGRSERRQALEFLSGYKIVVTELSPELVEDAITQAYLGSDKRVERSLAKLRRGIAVAAEPRAPDIPPARGDAAEFLSTLMEFAAARAASDLHLCPTPKGALLRLRIDGELLTQDEHLYPRSLHEQVVSRIKVLAGLDIASRLLPQDGAFSFSFGAGVRSVRVSTLPVLDGESVVLRFLYTRKLPQLSMLGIEPTALRIMRRGIERGHGVIILAGPTGSGKTTTMYSVVLELQHRGRNIVTVEDPVESPIPGMVQVQVREAQGLDYPRAIRSVLRHDPDVIMIGEIRDPLSASIALGAAASGHLTVTSLHMPSALSVFDRLRTFSLPAIQVAQAVSLVVNQRLIPKLCDRCKVVDHRVGGEVTYRSQGCASCGGGGFIGRVLVTEVFDLQSAEVKEIAGRCERVSELIEALPSSSFVPWTVALQHHLLSGAISASQVDRFVAEEM